MQHIYIPRKVTDQEICYYRVISEGDSIKLQQVTSKPTEKDGKSILRVTLERMPNGTYEAAVYRISNGPALPIAVQTAKRKTRALLKVTDWINKTQYLTNNSRVLNISRPFVS